MTIECIFNESKIIKKNYEVKLETQDIRLFKPLNKISKNVNNKHKNSVFTDAKKYSCEGNRPELSVDNLGVEISTL